jgi:Cys-rich protein (TIGR01571 family)
MSVLPPPSYQRHQPPPQQGMCFNIPRGPGIPANTCQIIAYNKRDWNHGLLDYCDDHSTCCLALYCPCIVYQQVKQRIEHLRQIGQPDPAHGGSGCGFDCCLHCILSAGCAGWALQVRHDTIHREYINNINFLIRQALDFPLAQCITSEVPGALTVWRLPFVILAISPSRVGN